MESGKNEKFYWKEELLSVLGMPYDNYSIDEIKKFCEKNSIKKGSYLVLSNEQLRKIDLKMYHFQKLRFSYFVNFIMTKFTIDNKRPLTKYFCSNESYNPIEKNRLMEIYTSIL